MIRIRSASGGKPRFITITPLSDAETADWRVGEQHDGAASNVERPTPIVVHRPSRIKAS